MLARLVLRILLLYCCLATSGCAGLASQSSADSSAGDSLPTSATVGDNDIIAIAVPGQKCCDKQTLPQFLGLDQLGAGLGGIMQRILSRFQVSLGLEGKFPGLQPQEPLKSLTDPANLSEDSPPSVQAAAKIKAEQDQAKQKIQALRYLSTIGCGGCYPEVEDALLAALDDCTESVRYEAVKALRGKRGNSCCYCNQNGCCSANVQKKLNEIVNKVGKSGAYIERSERVRRMARVVLSACPPVAESSGIPEEGPTAEPVAEDGTNATDLKTLSKIIDPGVQPASFDLRDQPERDYCLASIDGHKLMLSELNVPADHLTQNILQRRIGELVVQKQFIRESGRFSEWDESLKPMLLKWLKNKGVFETPTEKELTTYFDNNIAEFELPVAVRWETLSVRFEDLTQKSHVRNQLELLRDDLNSNREVTPLTVADASVKTFDWTLPSEIEDQKLWTAIFETEIGKTSGIVEYRNQLILVRVLEKRKSQTRSFSSVRASIVEKLESIRIRDAISSMYDTVRPEYQIWTIYDQPSQNQSTQISKAAGNPNTQSTIKSQDLSEQVSPEVPGSISENGSQDSGMPRTKRTR